MTDLGPMMLPFLAGSATLAAATWTIVATAGPVLPLWPSLATLAALGLTMLACRTLRRELFRRFARRKP